MTGSDKRFWQFPTPASTAAIAAAVAAAIAAAASLPYWFYTLPAPFYADDWIYLHRYGQTPLSQLSAFFSADSVFFWRPLPKLLMRAQFLAFGLNPAGYHVVSILLHVAATGALGAFVAVWMRPAHGAALAALAGLLFATSWAVGDSVLWISSQSALLAAALTWPALALWVVWLRRPASRGAYWSAFALLGAQLLVKESALNVLPALWVLSCSEALGKPDSPDGSVRGARSGPFAAGAMARLWRLLWPLWPGVALALAFGVFYVAFLRDAALGARTGYQWAPCWRWPLQLGQALSHMLLAPLGGATPVTGNEPSILYLWLARDAPLIGPALVALAFALRTPHARTAFALALVLLLPTLLLTVFHQGRYYYAPSQAFALALAALMVHARGALARRLGGSWRALALVTAALLIAYAGANWARLWTMAAVDNVRSQSYGQLHAFLAANKERVPPGSVLVVADRLGRPDYGLPELAKLATGDETCEAVFMDAQLSGAYYHHIVRDLRHAFIVRRDRPTGALSLDPADKQQLFPARE